MTLLFRDSDEGMQNVQDVQEASNSASLVNKGFFNRLFTSSKEIPVKKKEMAEKGLSNLSRLGMSFEDVLEIMLLEKPIKCEIPRTKVRGFG